jgi:TolA-binding protein
VIRNKFFLPILSVFLFSSCVVHSDVTQEQEVATPISDLNVACANNTQSIEELKAENAKIRGELERLEHLIKQKEASIVANEEKNQENKINQEPAVVAATAAVAAKKNAATVVVPVPTSLDIDEQYKLAKKNHDQKNYAEAEKYYTAMVGSKSIWYDERARFFLGKMYVDSGDYKKAIITFQDFIDKYPNSKNTANAIYTQAEAFYALNQKQEAEVFYKDVIQRFPRTKEASLAKKRLKTL